MGVGTATDRSVAAVYCMLLKGGTSTRPTSLTPPLTLNQDHKNDSVGGI